MQVEAFLLPMINPTPFFHQKKYLVRIGLAARWKSDSVLCYNVDTAFSIDKKKLIGFHWSIQLPSGELT